MVKAYKMRKFKTKQTAVEYAGWYKCGACGTPYPTKALAAGCCQGFRF